MRLIANSYLTTSLVVLVALAAGEVRGANIDASSAVDAVTVYPDGASVTRVVTLDLSAGENSAVLKDFPLTLDPSSLRVEGEAGAKLLGTGEVLRRQHGADADDRFRHLGDNGRGGVPPCFRPQRDLEQPQSAGHQGTGEWNRVFDALDRDHRDDGSQLKEFFQPIRL